MQIGRASCRERVPLTVGALGLPSPQLTAPVNGWSAAPAGSVKVPVRLKAVAAPARLLVGATTGVLTVGATLATVMVAAALVPLPPSLSATVTVTLNVPLWA